MNEMNDNDDNNNSNNDDIYEYPFLVCCRCNHDLNHPAYKIYKHPDLGTPLCILCNDYITEVDLSMNNISNDTFDNDNEICTWCKDNDCGDFYMCGDGTKCSILFCKDCINNYPNNQLKEEIDNNEEWLCLKCEGNKFLQPYYNAIEFGNKNSWYSICTEDNLNLDDLQISNIMKLLQALLEEEQDTISRLSMKNRSFHYQNILNELKEKYNDDFNDNIKKLAEDELIIYISQWQRHLDLISRQITDLDEVLEINGYDSTCLIKETINVQNDDVNDDLLQKDSEDLMQIDKKIKDNIQNDDDETNDNVHFYIQDILGCEENSNEYKKIQKRLIKLETFANKDLELNEFIDNPQKPDLNNEIFPSDFKYLFPKIVLKALYYLGINSEKGKGLINRYKISEFPHVLLVMKYIDQNISKNGIQWPTMKHLHPAVIKVLRSTDRPSDIELIGNYYNLNSLDAIDDMGDIQEVYNLYQTSGLEHKKKLRMGNNFEKIVNDDDEVEVRFTLSEVIDADENEKNSECLSIQQKNQIMTGSFGENEDIKKHNDSLFLKKRNSKRKLSDKSVSLKNSQRLNNPRFKSKIIKDIGEKSKSSDVDDDCNINDFVEDDLLDNDLTRFDNINKNKNGGNTKALSAVAGKKDTFILPTESPLYIQSIKNKKDNESSDKSSKFIDQSSTSNKKKDVEIIELLDSDDDFIEINPSKKTKGSSDFFGQSVLLPNKGDNLDRLLSTFDRKEALRKKVIELFPHLDPLDDDSDYVVLNNKRISKGDEPIYLMKHFQNKMKQHQKDGLQFIWNNVIDEIDPNPNSKKKGGGCILAHCMGLGKTLTIIAFTVTVLASPILHNYKFDPTPPVSKGKASTSKSPTKGKSQSEMDSFLVPKSSQTPTNTEPRNYFFTVLIITPVNTLTNWVNEFNNWCPDVLYRTRKNSYMNVTLLSADDTKVEDRVRKMKKWHQEGGVLIMGYDMFRNLVDIGKKNDAMYISDVKKYLLEPGADIVICDEAHTIKEKKSKITEMLSKIATKRRIALTGSPLQNNLEEYYQMVSWVRPRFLGTLTNFKKSYVQIIAAGEHKEACPTEVLAMRKRAYMLHKKLKPLVDRKDLSELEKTLPPKREFSVLIRMSEFQGFMYKTFLAKLIYANRGKNGKLIFTAFQALLRVWNHPAIAVINSIQKSNTKNKNKSKQVITMKVLEKEIEPVVDFFDSQDNEFLQKISENVHKLEADLAEEKSSLKVGDSVIDLVDDSDDDDFDDNDDYIVADETQIDVDESSVMQISKDKENYDDGLANQYLNDNSTICSDITPMKSDLSSEDLGSSTKLNDSTLNESEAKICDESWWKLQERSQNTPSLEHGEFIKLSNKLFIFLSILASSINAGDKVLVFTQSVMTLELLECVLKSERWGDVIDVKSNCTACKFSQWKENYHYLRIDGSTSDRQDMIDKFNKTDYIKLFMLSTKAGNMGINLQAANRVVIFDSSWNPAHDLQAIYRAYRFGQTKNVFVYRLLAAGTMEEKIYKKQINKMTRSARIVDAQMPDNHFTMEEKAELLKFTEYQDADFEKIKDSLSREPKDNVLLKIIETSTTKQMLHAIDDQTALLEDKDDLKLNENEMKEADEELAKEENAERQLTPPSSIPIQTEEEEEEEEVTPGGVGDPPSSPKIDI